VGQKKLVRKAEPPSKRGIRWPRWTGFRGMTVRDWLQLLIVPFALVVIGFLFTLQQDARQQAIEDQRAQQAQKIENKRAEAERELAEQRAQDEALQAYLDQMSGLLLERDLRASEVESEVRTLARARTLTVLARLDPRGRTAAMQFLEEAVLIQHVEGIGPIIRLNDAALSKADLRYTDLRYANLSDANLSDAKLRGANLKNADLGFTDLSKADLSKADLSGDFGTYLGYADLSDADLTNTNLGNNTDLGGADLSGADLSGAEGITNEELEQQAASLKGATMPNGQKYEDWLKDRESGKEDAAIRGLSTTVDTLTTCMAYRGVAIG
jgi:uncharacterized protein YjbI with pentapeptide repeats